MVLTQLFWGIFYTLAKVQNVKDVYSCSW